MTKSDIIKKIVAENTEPDQELTPTLLLEYPFQEKGVKHMKRYNTRTGDITILDRQRMSAIYCDDDRYGQVVLHAPSNRHFAMYSKYYPEYECYEIAGIAIDSSRAKEINDENNTKVKNTDHNCGDTRTWHYSEYGDYHNTPRLFIFRGDSHVYEFTGAEYAPTKMGKYYNKAFINMITQEYGRYDWSEGWSKETIKFIGDNINALWAKHTWLRDRNDIYPWVFANWLKSANKSQKPSKLSTEIKDINTLVTKDISEYCDAIRIIRRETGSKYSWNQYVYDNERIIAFEALPDGWGVFRHMYRGTDDQYRIESFRLFISPKGKPTFYLPNGNKEWNISGASITSILGSNYYYANAPKIAKVGFEDLDKVEHLKYLKALLEKQDNPKEIIMTIVNTLRHPIVEMAWKSGYPNIAQALMYDNKIAANLLTLFNAKEKKGKLTEILGLNKEQLKYIENMLNDRNEECYGRNNAYAHSLRRDFIQSAKELAGVDRLSDLSKESTEKIFQMTKMLTKNEGFRGWRADLLYSVEDDGTPIPYNAWRWRYDGNEEIHLSEAERQKVLHVLKVCKNTDTFLSMYKDIIRMYCNLNDELRPEINVYELDDEVSIRRTHDGLAELINQQNRERARYDALKAAKKEKFNNERIEKLYKKRVEKYAYEDDTYAMIIPAKCSEVVSEGVKQKICIGSYCEAIASGSTDIIFLRKKECIDSPFYAIEVKGGHMVQMHGFGNCYLGCNPEAIPFTVKWLREKNITFDKHDLLSTAQGYYRGNNFLDGSKYGL